MQNEIAEVAGSSIDDSATDESVMFELKEDVETENQNAAN
jgi:hypothetical protein